MIAMLTVGWGISDAFSISCGGGYLPMLHLGETEPTTVVDMTVEDGLKVIREGVGAVEIFEPYLAND